MDFGVVKQLVGGWIDENWDHTTLVNWKDKLLLDFCRADPALRSPYIFNGEPTAEIIAAELLRVAGQLLANTGVTVVKVRVWETPTCWAEVTPKEDG